MPIRMMDPGTPDDREPSEKIKDIMKRRERAVRRATGGMSYSQISAMAQQAQRALGGTSISRLVELAESHRRAVAGVNIDDVLPAAAEIRRSMDLVDLASTSKVQQSVIDNYEQLRSSGAISAVQEWQAHIEVTTRLVSQINAAIGLSARPLMESVRMWTIADSVAHRYANLDVTNAFVPVNLSRPLSGAPVLSAWAQEAERATRRLGPVVCQEFDRIRDYIPLSTSLSIVASALDDNRRFRMLLYPATSGITHTSLTRPTKHVGPLPPSGDSGVAPRRQVPSANNAAAGYFLTRLQERADEAGIPFEEFMQRIADGLVDQVLRQATFDRQADKGAAELSEVQPPATLTGQDRNATTRIAFCVQVDATEENSVLTRAEYSRLIEETDLYDLVVDGLTGKVYRKLENGSVRCKALSPAELQLISHAILSKRPFAPRRVLGSCSEKTAGRRIQGALQKADIRRSRYQCYVFKTMRKGEGAPPLYHFDPPRDFKWVLLSPTEQV